jgi:hypothetical protein
MDPDSGGPKTYGSYGSPIRNSDYLICVVRFNVKLLYDLVTFKGVGNV